MPSSFSSESPVCHRSVVNRLFSKTATGEDGVGVSSDRLHRVLHLPGYSGAETDVRVAVRRLHQHVDQTVGHVGPDPAVLHVLAAVPVDGVSVDEAAVRVAEAERAVADCPGAGTRREVVRIQGRGLSAEGRRRADQRGCRSSQKAGPIKNNGVHLSLHCVSHGFMSCRQGGRQTSFIC